MSRLQNRGAAIASKLGSHSGFVNAADPMWEPSLLAMNDDAVYLPNRPGQPIIFFGRGVA